MAPPSLLQRPGFPKPDNPALGECVTAESHARCRRQGEPGASGCGCTPKLRAREPACRCVRGATCDATKVSWSFARCSAFVSRGSWCCRRGADRRSMGFTAGCCRPGPCLACSSRKRGTSCRSTRFRGRARSGGVGRLVRSWRGLAFPFPATDLLAQTKLLEKLSAGKATDSITAALSGSGTSMLDDLHEIADQIKWECEPSFDPVPFLSDPVVARAFREPDVLGLDRDDWPQLPPAQVHAERSKVLRLATKLDQTKALRLFPAIVRSALRRL